MDDRRKGEQALVDRRSLDDLAGITPRTSLAPFRAGQVHKLQGALARARRALIAAAALPAVHREATDEVRARAAIVGAGGAHVALALGGAQQYGERVQVLLKGAHPELVLGETLYEHAARLLKQLEVGSFGREQVVALLVVHLEAAEPQPVAPRAARIAAHLAQHVLNGERDQARLRSRPSGRRGIAEHCVRLATRGLAVCHERTVHTAQQDARKHVRYRALVHLRSARFCAKDICEGELQISEPIGAARAREHLALHCEPTAVDVKG